MFKLPEKPFKIRLGEDEYLIAPQDFLINGRNDDDLREGAGKLFFFYALKARAAKLHRLARRAEHRWEAKKIERLTGEGAKLPEWKARNAVLTDDEKESHDKAISQAAYAEGLAEACCIAAQAKVDLLRTFRADQRKEWDVSPDIDPASESRKERSEKNRDKVTRARKGKE